MNGVRLGAFGWGTHVAYGHGRTSKRRPCVVIMDHQSRFAVIFGRTKPRPNARSEVIGDQSEVGRRMGLTEPTFFQGGEVARLPDDFDVRGFFATTFADASDPDAVADHSLWLKLRALLEPPKPEPAWVRVPTMPTDIAASLESLERSSRALSASAFAARPPPPPPPPSTPPPPPPPIPDDADE